ncbi:MAG: hypothetical protein EWM45_00600 [Rhodopseudomonas palustris]|uniref:hypothetical protein n=1 Tax=Rhodopseudomonas faecalis TaxID=99655 RepID=UPI000DA22C6E|nr:hypothetical protein [Rhodopseudomonas faecalis]TAH69285.1 MAG: hypothetical protein EWM45_00600 [Rhodopseudomonas palustris]
MGTVIAFPAYAVGRLDGRLAPAPRQIEATVLILPVIRIERHRDGSDGNGPKEGAAAGRRRRRRARS